jgi:hypothetical protein
MKTLLFLVLLGGADGFLSANGLATKPAALASWPIAIALYLLLTRVHLWRNGYSIESYRADAILLRHTEPETYALVLAEVSDRYLAKTDPDVCVAAWLREMHKLDRRANRAHA